MVLRGSGQTCGGNGNSSAFASSSSSSSSIFVLRQLFCWTSGPLGTPRLPLPHYWGIWIIIPWAPMDRYSLLFFFWPVLFQVTAVESRSYDSGQHLVDASASSVVLLDPHTSHINYCLRLRSMILLFCSVHAASIACLSVLGEGSLLCGSFFPTIKSVFFSQYGKFPPL